jgi:glycogen debranching enzyme
VARATLRALAALQGRKDDPERDEEPGKIIHEYRPHAPERFAQMGWPVRDGELRYWGSVDATPWFLVVLAALGDPALAGELEPQWRAAGGWLERSLARGAGFVRWGARRSPGGLVQQGWRDTTDPTQSYGGGILREDGTPPEAPVADADTQAVAYAGLRALARLSGDQRFERAARELGGRIEAAFGPETMAIEADGREVTGAGSQLGWLLWSGAVSGASAAGLAERLCRPDVLTGFGLRTLSDRHPRFGADSYHRGAVWPFDSWLGWGGLRAAGREREAARVKRGVLEALDRLGQAPELYAVTEAGPEPIEIANRVQAWTVGARWALANEWDGRPTGVL